SASTSTRCPCSALATADRRVLATMRAAFLGVYSRIPSAFSTGWPRIMLTTKRAFCAVTREKRLVPRASLAHCPSAPRGGGPGAPAGLDLALPIARMAVEGARGREFTQLVTDGVLGDEHRDELPPVVHGEGEADHLGRHRGASRPRLDYPLLTGFDHR